MGVTAHELYAGDIKSVLVSQERIAARTAELGAELGHDYADALAGQDLLLVTVLKGAVMFVTDLARAIPLPTQLEFMAVSSYGAATKSSGVVRIIKDLDIDLTDRHVILVEDIIDSGLTLSYLRKNLLARKPASLEICAMFIKKDLQKTKVECKYEGFFIPPDFVVGYGLDARENLRGLDYLAELKMK